MNYDNKIDDFKNYLLLEKKYSQNTIDSYGRDLEKFKCFFQNKKQLINLTDKDYKTKD